MSAIFVTILKKLGTRLLLTLAEIAVDELGGRNDNPVSRDTVDVLKKAKVQHDAANGRKNKGV